MSDTKNIAQRQWGQAEIGGGRHRFRQGLLMERITRYAPAGSLVLDAGCGVGSLTVSLLNQGYRVSAVEFSAPSLDKLLAKLPVKPGAAGGPPLTIGQCSLEALPFPDAFFDAEVSGEVLEHVKDDQAAARELARVLKPGGALIMTVPANPKLWNEEDEWAGHQRRYTADGLRKLFEDAGLETVELKHWGWPITYLYNRILFRAWLKRRLRQGDADAAPSGLGANPLLQRLMSAVFSVDRLFMSLPLGIGLIGVFRKPA